MKKEFMQLSILTLMLFGLSACGEDNKTTERVQTNTNQSEIVSEEQEKGAFTPAYLEGVWCYTERVMKMGEEAQRSQINMDFEFKKDGGFYYNQHSKAPMELKGKWTLNNGNLVVTPTFMNINLSKVVDENKFEFGENKMGMSMINYMIRGECRK